MRRTLLSPALIVLAAVTTLPAFEFNADLSCVLLNSDNTDILTTPTDCDAQPSSWCNCTRTLLTNPKPGEKSGVEQGVIWVRREPGIANHRIEIKGGTLSLTGLAVGAVIGKTKQNELVPQAIAPPGTFFATDGEMVVTAVNGNDADFDVVLRQVSPFVLSVLRYDPLDAAHSSGLLYRGRLTALGAGQGGVIEIRYEGLPGAKPAIEPGDADSPGFNVRQVFTFLTPESGLYTVPGGDTLRIVSTLRSFNADDYNNNTGEILPLGEADFCKVVVNAEPCRQFDEFLPVNASGANNPPDAVIVVTDPRTLQPIPEPVEILIDCGEGRAIFRGSNSIDGEGGSQGLAYTWTLTAGDPNGVLIPGETANFMDTEVEFILPGKYRIKLTVDDRQPTNNTDSLEVEIVATEGIGPNSPPEATITAEPGTTVSLVNGQAQVHLRSSANTGTDGCAQELTYLWELISGPAGSTFDATVQDDVLVTMTAGGTYVVRLTVDDGAPADHTAQAEITIQVGEIFSRCDSNGDGGNDVSDAVFSLGFLFQGGEDPKCAASVDCNGDGQGDISDSIFNLGFLFLGQESPPAPYPACEVAGQECKASTACTP